MEENQRKRTRVQFTTSVNLIGPERSFTDLSSRDISLKGLFVESKEQFPLDTPVDIDLTLTGSTSALSIKMKGRVARLEEEGMGIEFSEIDMDSFFHLRNILYYNAEDPAKIDEELTSQPAF